MSYSYNNKSQHELQQIPDQTLIEQVRDCIDDIKRHFKAAKRIEKNNEDIKDEHDDSYAQIDINSLIYQFYNVTDNEQQKTRIDNVMIEINKQDVMSLTFFDHKGLIFYILSCIISFTE